MYAPDLHLIEGFFDQVKRLLHEAEARSRKASIEAIGVASSAITIGTPAAF